MTRITHIKLVSYPSFYPEIDLPITTASPTDPYIVTLIDGLGPPEVDVMIAKSVYRGGVYQGSMPKDREIVFHVSLNPTYSSSPVSVADLRAKLYPLINSPDPVRVYIYTDSVAAPGNYVPAQVHTDGYVRHLEIAAFTKDPTVQIVITCPSPYLSKHLPDNAGGIPFTNPFPYNGTAKTGFSYWFALPYDITNLALVSQANSTTAVDERLIIPGISVAGTTFRIDTRAGSRYVKKELPGLDEVWYDITGLCTIQNDRWPSLYPGSNSVEIQEGFTEKYVTQYSLMFYNQYWGI